MDHLLNKKEQLQKINNGKGIQHILDEAYRILDNPILIHDMDYKLIAYTENTVHDDPIWNEYETTGMVGYDRLVFYEEEGFLEICADAKKTTFLLSDKLKYDRIYGKLFTNNDIQIGCICMVACYNSFEDGTSKLFEIVCDILNKEFSISEYYQAYGQAYMETLISQIIEESIEDIYMSSSIYIGLKDYIRVAVVDITQCDPKHTKLACFRDMFKQARPDFKYAVYSNYIVIIMSSDIAPIRIDDLDKLYGIFEQNNICAGISRCFENLNELPKYYNEAVNVLNHMLKSGSKHRFFLYDDIFTSSSDD